MTPSCFRLAATALLGLASLSAQAAPITGAHITATTNLGQYFGFSIDQMVDGITADSPFNGYASGPATLTGAKA